MTESERYQIAQKQVTEQKKFWGHLVAFIAVNAGLIGLNLFTHPEKLWFPWVLMGWGAGLLLHPSKSLEARSPQTGSRKRFRRS